MNKITKHSVPHTRKQLPSPTLIHLGSIVPGKLGVILVLGSGGLGLRTPPLEHLLKYGRKVKGTYNEARVQGDALQEDKDPIVPSLCL